MIFKTLTLNNFRAFEGEHNIDLGLRRDGLISKPIVLFGGLNGAGKTSILTGIRLSLLGKRALSKAVFNTEYHNYLIEEINRNVLRENEDTCAEVSLEFTHTHQGKHNLYKISRSWSKHNKPTLTLSENGELVSNIKEDDKENFLRDLVPTGVEDLFFFDGEKIAELAEDNTGSYLKEAVRKLLGLDLVARLSEDLDIYKRQEIIDKAGQVERDKIQSLEDSKALLKKSTFETREKIDICKNKIDSIDFKISQVEQKIASLDDQYEKNKETDNEAATQIQANIKQKESQILNEFDGAFAVSLAKKSMATLLKQINAERQIKNELAFFEQLNAFLPSFEEKLDLKAPGSRDAIIDIFNESIPSNLDEKKSQIKLDLAHRESSLIDTQVNNLAVNSSRNVGSLLSELKDLEYKRDNLALSIERAPKEKEVAELYQDLRQLDKERSAAGKEYIYLLQVVKNYITETLDVAKRLEKLYASQKINKVMESAILRIDATKEVLTNFNVQLTNLRLKQLQELFEESYRKLARKGDIKLTANIDPETFDVTLIDNEGHEIKRKSMSAGEKQIFAISILEALGKLSGKMLPVVVDTPLGRLDSHHRENLVNHYFPEASEQVIVLSTDTEVDEAFLNDLLPNISHAFEINFDQQSRTSSVKEGYFWNPELQEAS
ncbi:DNA sulfur modification protein DndD [Thalassomonas sp. M1454]|uniref:DNA sulfur modification protein DndD n=1 Tax=Thalassomonas sp. M1454 TaxID=2594477 RepID=UPI0011809970|nr:DNA sulfur modification protein DndD [Thalassomonas sp. M1454]TRX56695.1 DNA sulfur modification protein DndD [Thalassomonas sp. M1454]